MYHLLLNAYTMFFIPYWFIIIQKEPPFFERWLTSRVYRVYEYMICIMYYYINLSHSDDKISLCLLEKWRPHDLHCCQVTPCAFDWAPGSGVSIRYHDGCGYVAGLAFLEAGTGLNYSINWYGIPSISGRLQISQSISIYV